MIVGLIYLLIWIVIVGLIWWVVKSFLPLPGPLGIVVDVIAVLLVVLLLINFVGMPPHWRESFWR